MEKRTFLWLLLIAAVLPFRGESQTHRFGIGLTFGTPTGISMKYLNSSQDAIHGYVGGGFGGVALGADYMFYSKAFRDPNFALYYGPGAFVGPTMFGPIHPVNEPLGVGVRFVMGVDYVLPHDPFDLSFELGPALAFSPDVGFGLMGGLAIRFYP